MNIDYTPQRGMAIGLLLFALSVVGIGVGLFYLNLRSIEFMAFTVFNLFLLGVGTYFMSESYGELKRENFWRQTSTTTEDQDAEACADEHKRGSHDANGYVINPVPSAPPLTEEELVKLEQQP